MDPIHFGILMMSIVRPGHDLAAKKKAGF